MAVYDRSKKIYSTAELVEMGYTKYMLYQAAHHKLADKYLVRSPRNGKFYFRYKELQRYSPIIFGGK